VIGLGNMAAALAEALLTAGFTVSVWNRSAARAKPLVQRGARLGQDPADAIAGSQATIVCLADHDAFVEVIHNDTVASALASSCLIQLGVVTAEQARASGSWAQGQTINYLEGSIMGMPINVKNASAMLVCSGPQNLFDTHQALLSVFGTPRLLSETVGNAYEFDKVYYSFGYAVMFGFLQGAALAEAGGFSVAAYTDIVLTRIPVIGEYLRRFGGMAAIHDHTGDQATIAVWADAYAKSLDLCRALERDDTLPAAIVHVFDKAIAAGYADSELSAIVEVL
jgi:3-hydroxyisobutyrate dehydrogenase-like beta-hydroxyacid dehydrogenase